MVVLLEAVEASHEAVGDQVAGVVVSHEVAVLLKKAEVPPKVTQPR